MEQKKLFDCNVLITKEEYIAFYLQQNQLRRKTRSLSVYFLGSVLLVLGLIGVFFGKQIGFTLVWNSGLLSLSVLCFCFEGVMTPMLLRAQAARIYEEQPEVRQATQYLFYQDAVEIHSSRENGKIPLQCLTEWTQSESFLALYFGREITVVLPKRVLQREQIQQLTEVLQAI